MAFLTRWGGPSRALFHWRASDTSLRALTAQAGAFTRASPATGTDHNGATYTVADDLPCWTVTSGKVGLFIRPADAPRTAEACAWPFPAVMPAHSGYLAWIERGTASITGGRYLQIGATDDSDPRIVVRQDGSGTAVVWDDGSAERTSVISGQPSNGDLVEVRWSITASGVLTTARAINGAAEVAGSEPAAGGALPDTMSAAFIHLGSRGGSDIGNAEFRRLLLWPVAGLSMAELRGCF